MKKTFLAIAAIVAAFAVGYSAHSTEVKYVQVPTDSIDWYGLPKDSIREYIYMAEDAYCREIDSLVFAHGAEIDADVVDIENPEQMEKAACKILGEAFFYRWRNKESKTAWEYDVLIARYCY